MPNRPRLDVAFVLVATVAVLTVGVWALAAIRAALAAYL